MSKATLYTFGASVWAAVPELALVELGYTGDQVVREVVNLGEGENFKPSFLKLNPRGTLPTLRTADGNVYTSTETVTRYLVENASVKVAPGTPSFIAKIHDDQFDPNFAFLLARDDKELAAKASGFPLAFLQNRQSALNRNASTPEGVEFKSFYDAKIVGNGGLLSIYKGEAPADVKSNFFSQSQKHWDSLRAFITQILPATLESTTKEKPFLGGERPGEDDFHLAAWLARIAFVAGGKPGKDGLKVLEKELGEDVPDEVVDYWNAWAARDSWKKVYEGGLH
ncbi:hypothetical protein GLOTRDRAFT_57733 [Gloeophyllum trabeum ATCC 11539]|uniref:GST N-terminal domain-containing protein n=1 Tax=Gloeophyllum trabeum (strain ATCC 11539 / FP-39264 / Madison 617) TaxID=670483 RepID=S7RV33_GLOTA|nr:uncharacterized protein GLOTRDRAFT_57733 [Gloeophyllum trabeum ATCC 11539]EPQ58625.1 hypothetical protein GLOTRDRAFT_57733 [Gloeophyllum trabeum ATCC 11539]